MEGTYPVYFGKEAVGKIQLTRQGLYFRIVCRCRTSTDLVCRLVASWDGGKESLGVPVPMGDGFGLETRVAAKKLGQGPLEFALVPKHEVAKGTFVPIVPEEPFRYIARLKESYLVKRNGQVGILV